MKYALIFSMVFVSTTQSVWACPGASAKIPLASDSCNAFNGKEYADCLSDRSHSVQFGQLSSLDAYGHGFTIEGRSFTYEPRKKTWCERTLGGCLQVFPRPSDEYFSTVLVGFCKETNTSKTCKVSGLPVKGSARKGSEEEIGYIAFNDLSATIMPTHDKDGYQFSTDQRFMVIDVTAIELQRMFGLRFEAKIYDPTLKSLDQSYELASNMDTSGGVYRGLPRADESSRASAKPEMFGKEGSFKFSGNCGSLRNDVK